MTALRVSPRHWFAGGATSTLVLLAAATPLGAEDQQGAAGNDSQTILVEGTKQQGFGAGIAPSGANSYALTEEDIDTLPLGASSDFTDVLAQMPGVAIDQYQMVHVRDNEGAGFQYTINGFIVPIDINTNPPFLTMINPAFVAHLELLDGILPAKYNYADGGVVAIDTKTGNNSPGGLSETMVGMHDTYQESLQYGESIGAFSYFVNLKAGEDNLAFSPATPASNQIHDHQSLGQGFAFFNYQVTEKTSVSLLLSGNSSNNQFPNVPGQTPTNTLAGYPNPPDSSTINSDLDMRDGLAMLMLRGDAGPGTTYDVGLASHTIEQKFIADPVGDLIYEGVAPSVTKIDVDYTAQADIYADRGAHHWSFGVYAGAYGVTSDSSTLVFPVDANGNQTSDTPEAIGLGLHSINILTGLYAADRIDLDPKWSTEIGLRWDTLSGITYDDSVDPRVSLTYKASSHTTFHLGFARQTQVPTFSGISASAPQEFANTTNDHGAGGSYPMVEHDSVIDGGVRCHPMEQLMLYWDSFFEYAKHYLDAGLYGDTPIYAPLNYHRGYLWDTELGGSWKEKDTTIYANFTMGRNYEHGVDSGQFNFDPTELAYIDNHYFLIDHEPLAELNDGIAYRLAPFTVSLDSVYSSGLRGGFADYERLPSVFQVNAGIIYDLKLPGVGKASDRVTILNLFNRVNQLRPSSGIGVFQASYGPRFTVYDTLSIPF